MGVDERVFAISLLLHLACMILDLIDLRCGVGAISGEPRIILGLGLLCWAGLGFGNLWKRFVWLTTPTPSVLSIRVVYTSCHGRCITLLHHLFLICFHPWSANTPAFRIFKNVRATVYQSEKMGILLLVLKIIVWFILDCMHFYLSSWLYVQIRSLSGPIVERRRYLTACMYSWLLRNHMRGYAMQLRLPDFMGIQVNFSSYDKPHATH